MRCRVIVKGTVTGELIMDVGPDETPSDLIQKINASDIDWCAIADEVEVTDIEENPNEQALWRGNGRD